jgi:hypothetical protein
MDRTEVTAGRACYDGAYKATTQATHCQPFACSENDYEAFGIEYPLVICATNHNLMDAVKYLIDECQADVNALSLFDKVLSCLIIGYCS